MPDTAPSPRKRANLAVLGSTGLKQHSGYIAEEFLISLRGRNGVKMYTEMSENNSVVGSILFIIDMLVRQVEWRVQTKEGMEDNPQAKKWKEFVEGALNDMSHTWEDFISEVLSMLVFGWSFFEVVYKIRKGDTPDPKTKSEFDDGKWGWRKVEIRSQDSLLNWIFDHEGGLDGMTQLDTYQPQGPVDIPIEKAVLFRTRSSKGNPEAKSLLRPAVRDWFFLKRIQEIEAIGIERDLAGMPIMEVPLEILAAEASADDQALRSQLELMIQQVRVDERWGGLIPSELDSEGKPTGFKFRLQTTGGRRMIQTNDIIKRYESRIAMVFLAEFIMIGMDKVGTESLHSGKSSMFKLALETILTDMIASPFNRFAVNPLMKLNGVPREFWPLVTPGKLDSPDLEKIGKLLTSMAQSGVLSPNQPLENKLLAFAKLPPPPDEDAEIFDDPTNPTPSRTEDQTSGLLSPQQIDAVMVINRAIKDGDMTLEAAKELAASALGMDPKNVSRFLSEAPEEPEEPGPPEEPEAPKEPEDDS